MRNKKAYISNKRYYAAHPWAKTLRAILARCNCKSNHYYKNGIKNFLTKVDLKFLWFRDKAYLMKRSSIDRKNTKGNYTLNNCRYIEFAENMARSRNYGKSVKQLTPNNKLIKIWNKMKYAAKALKISQGDISCVCNKKLRRKTAGGYRWEFV